MAKPTISSKRDNEKKKHEKRVKKQKRKEERKVSGKTGNFDDMIAYVDENGMITSVPPELQVKTGNKTAEQQEAENQTTGLKGRIEYMNAEKGFGFVKDVAGTEKYYFQIKDATKDVKIGDMVLFDLAEGYKGLNAKRLKPLNNN